MSCHQLISPTELVTDDREKPMPAMTSVCTTRLLNSHWSMRECRTFLVSNGSPEDSHSRSFDIHQRWQWRRRREHGELHSHDNSGGLVWVGTVIEQSFSSSSRRIPCWRREEKAITNCYTSIIRNCTQIKLCVPIQSAITVTELSIHIAVIQ